MERTMQQMMQRLLARMEEMNVNQEKAEASMSARMKSNLDLMARLEARIETNRENDREDLKEMREEIKSGQAEMRSTVCVIRSELEKTIQREMRGVIQPEWAELDETTAYNEATDTKLDPGLMQSIEEHQENRGSGLGSGIWPRSAARK
jgi:DNA replication protein DnaD